MNEDDMMPLEEGPFNGIGTATRGMAGRIGNATLASLGSKQAQGRVNNRDTVNKFKRDFQTYIGETGQQATLDSLRQWIAMRYDHNSAGGQSLAMFDQARLNTNASPATKRLQQRAQGGAAQGGAAQATRQEPTFGPSANQQAQATAPAAPAAAPAATAATAPASTVAGATATPVVGTHDYRGAPSPPPGGAPHPTPDSVTSEQSSAEPSAQEGEATKDIPNSRRMMQQLMNAAHDPHPNYRSIMAMASHLIAAANEHSRNASDIMRYFQEIKKFPAVTNYRPLETLIANASKQIPGAATASAAPKAAAAAPTPPTGAAAPQARNESIRQAIDVASFLVENTGKPRLALTEAIHRYLREGVLICETAPVLQPSQIDAYLGLFAQAMLAHGNVQFNTPGREQNGQKPSLWNKFKDTASGGGGNRIRQNPITPVTPHVATPVSPVQQSQNQVANTVHPQAMERAIRQFNVTGSNATRLMSLTNAGITFNDLIRKMGKGDAAVSQAIVAAAHDAK